MFITSLLNYCLRSILALTRPFQTQHTSDIPALTTYIFSKHVLHPKFQMQSILDSFSKKPIKQIPLYEDEAIIDNGWKQQDWASQAGKTYLSAILTAPFHVTETLLNVQQRGINAGSAPVGKLSRGPFRPIQQLISSQGTSSVFRGHMTTFLHSFIEQVSQPGLEELLNDALDVFEDTHPGTNILSHMIVGGLLSPMELARTRMIVQDGSQPKYRGLAHTLATIAEEEGGFLALFNYKHFIPTLIYHGLAPGLRLLSNHVITQTLNITSTFNPILYRVAQVVFLAGETAILAPLELARRRLQAQSVVPYATSVATTSQPYTGMFNVWYRTIAEEGQESEGEQGVVTRAKSLSRGFWSLYRGFWPMFCRSLIKLAFDEYDRLTLEYRY